VSALSALEKKNSKERDEALIKRMANGDQSALEELIKAWSRPVYSLAVRILNSPEMAEEVSQDVFLKAWRSAAVFEARRGAFSSWILTMTHHAAIDALRRRKTQGGQVTFAMSDAVSALLSSPAHSVSPWQKMRLQKALKELPEAQKTIVQMAYFEGRTREEIAELLRIPVGTVKTRLRDAIRRLGSIFSDPEQDLKSLKGFEA
jgi:RNA polymerase sigma-70 factor, ECF subfamily